MSTPITTAKVLPFDWGGHNYTAKQELPIICEPSRREGYISTKCEALEWTGAYSSERERDSEIRDLRRRINNHCLHYLLADDSALSPEGLSKKRQLDELFTVTKQ